MQVNIHLAPVVLLPLLLFLCAMFAATEASLFSLSRSQLEALKLTRPHLYAKIRNLIYRPDAMLSTVIIGNECLNITIATIITGMLEFQFGLAEDTWLIFLPVLVSSILLLTFSEILPKIIAFRMPVLVASIVVYPMTWVHFLLSPVRKVFLGVSSRIIGVFGIRAVPPTAISEQDFLTLVEVGAESGSLDRDEKDLIYNVFHFSDLSVSSIMTPWRDVFHVTDRMGVEEVLNEVKRKTYSRVPVVSTETGRVLGILYTKALLRLLLKPDTEQRPEALHQAMIPPYIVSTHKKVSKLFREFKLKKVHIALVVDEFGKQIGVVSLEDILNALFQTQPRKKKEPAT
jgi:putative hemolysin